MICTAFLLWLKDLVHMVEISLFSNLSKNHSTNKVNILLKSGRVNLLSQSVY